MPSVTVVSLPAEVIAMVIQCLAAINHKSYKPVEITKHELASCSLTCRYWARQCRPSIFGRIKLLSRADVLTLLSFLESPRSNIAPHIRYVSVEQKESREPYEPWIHLFVALVHKLPHVRWDLTLIDITSPPRPQSLRSIYRGLPRPLPSPSSLVALQITNYHLRAFTHLVRLVASLPSLEQLSCTRLSWDSDPVEFSRISNRFRHKHGLRVHMIQCQDHSSMIWLRPHMMQLGQLDVTIVCHLVRCIVSGIRYENSVEELHSSLGGSAETFGTGSFRPSLTGSNPQNETGLNRAEGVIYKFWITVPNAPAYDGAPALEFTFHEPEPLCTSVRSIYVYGDSLLPTLRPLDRAELGGYDWETFDKLAGRFLHLEEVVFRIKTDQPETLARVQSDLESRMPLLHELGKLNFQCIPETKGVYQQVHLSPMGEYELDAGTAQGISKDAEFALYRSRVPLSFSPPLMTLVAREPSTFSTLLVPRNTQPSTLIKDGFVLQTVPGARESLRVSIHADKNFRSIFKRLHEMIARTNESNRRIHLVDSQDATELEVRVCGDKILFDMVMSQRTHRISESLALRPLAPEDTYTIIRAAAHYLWQLRRKPPSSALRAGIDVKLHKLEQDDTQLDDWLLPVMLPDVKSHTTLRDGEEVDLFVDDDDKYGMTILNKESYIKSWNLDRDPLRPQESMTVGYGRDGGNPWKYYLDDWQESDFGFLKIFLTTKRVDLSHILQESPFAGSRDAPEPEPKKPIPLWDTITVMINQRKPSVRG
ncbi:hypothetical protein PHLCEN_2v4847 [Hermanssonia centrifuga]|uniref:Uncharacterized protein n=1 Tax=Hermanssonia centrifuga TaxID=98765 RepID=A0A2R6PGF5_9APHY|nr:hypothetical protein PHLCEN_2v4847 [Hermanssonia centrifuga]